MTFAMYGGSFDLVTSGHFWLMQNGNNLFDQLVIAVAESKDKRYTFSLEQRLAMVKAVAPPGTLVITIGNQYLVDAAAAMNCTHLLRGLRLPSDWEYERKMQNFNLRRAPHILTVFLAPPPELAEVSSSLVKSLIGPDGWQAAIQPYIPPQIYPQIVEAHS